MDSGSSFGLSNICGLQDFPGIYLLQNCVVSVNGIESCLAVW